MLTEKEAWLKIARFFKYNKSTYKCFDDKTQSDGYGFKVGTRRIIGICDYINGFLCNTYSEIPILISLETAGSILSKIRQHPNYTGRLDYIWPATKEGHQQRVKFCLEQAEKLT